MVLTGDVLDVLPSLEADSFDAMLTDPPYGLEFMGRDWDRVVPSVEVWRECLRVLKPGAFALVFGGTRTWHRLAVALEDAGFEVRDTLMWLYGQGFPKSHNLSGKWQGFGTALKPAWEPILLVRKPSPLTFAENALVHGAGALNIDASRVGTTKDVPASVSRQKPNALVYGKYGVETGDEDGHNPHVGRWPANVLHDGSQEVAQHFPEAKSSGHYQRGQVRDEGSTWGNLGRDEQWSQTYADSGSAARFFYCAKASTSERNAGLDHLPTVESEAAYGSVQDGRPHTSEGYQYSRPARRNPHPTVKPIALTEYLARLLLPPPRDAPRRILIPFAGSGSEAIGALRAGWDEAIGIEREAEYAQIAHARIAHHTAQPTIGGL